MELQLTPEYIRSHVADSQPIYVRGQDIYKHGSFILKEADKDENAFTYHVDGNYGDYTTWVKVENNAVHTGCDCPYPGPGCKHIVAVLLDARDIIERWKQAVVMDEESCQEPDFLTPLEIREMALEDRKRRARNEEFSITEGEMLKGQHLIEAKNGKLYTVTLHDPAQGRGHCSCPDFQTNGLGTCKHLIYLTNKLKKKRDFNKRLAKEKFPFVDIYWDSASDRPRLFHDQPSIEVGKLGKLLDSHFDQEGLFSGRIPEDLLALIGQLDGNKRVQVHESIFSRLNRVMLENQASQLSAKAKPDLSGIRADLYPYQAEGVSFALYRPAALIGDEMGLGKTLQAIALSVLKKEIFDFKRVLVITLASLKEQWKREIERFCDEKVAVVAGTPLKREAIYFGDDSYFKITNYEAVLRDVTLLSRYKPDLIILDEAQRIKNFSTKTADAVKRLPRKHALVLTGTPLENKLEDVYSIVQFLDPLMLAPLWRFAADHFMLSRNKKGKIIGYHNLDQLHQKLQSIVIRRRKEEVLSDLPREVTNNYYLDLHDKQQKIHSGYLQSLLPILNKKYLTPMDIRRMQELLLKMRMVCNSTYLIDRKTHISPKLTELEGIIDELVLQNKRKVVIFSEWTTMTYLIARHLSDVHIPFVELSGKVPVKKRQPLIDEFTHNPDCKVFLSTDAGGTGLNLQAADCVINFELPWSPARMNQRIGRVNRIGQTSKCVNVVNLITKNSIEEKILTGIQLKTDLFKGVFDGGMDKVEFSQEKRTELLNRLRKMMDEDPVPPAYEARPAEEVPEDTPYFLNPEVLRKVDQVTDYTAEEQSDEASADGSGKVADPSQGGGDLTAADLFAQHPPEKIETVLNSGMAFIGGLLEMATGQSVGVSSKDEKIVSIDRESGEVTLKFKLPGF